MSLPDNKTIEQYERKIKQCCNRLMDLAPHVGAARQIKEFSSDQRKNALAAVQIKFIQRGESAAASETLARSDPAYLEKFRALEEANKQAEQVIAEFTATQATLDATRSLLAMVRSYQYAGMER